MSHSETPEIRPTRPGYRIRILSDEQLDDLKAAALEILGETSVGCPSEKALRIEASEVIAAAQ